MIAADVKDIAAAGFIGRLQNPYLIRCHLLFVNVFGKPVITDIVDGKINAVHAAFFNEGLCQFRVIFGNYVEYMGRFFRVILNPGCNIHRMAQRSLHKFNGPGHCEEIVEKRYFLSIKGNQLSGIADLEAEPVRIPAQRFDILQIQRRGNRFLQLIDWITKISVSHDFDEVRLEGFVKISLPCQHLVRQFRMGKGISTYLISQEMVPESHWHAVCFFIIENLCD